MTPNHSTVNLAHAFASWKVPKSYTARLLGQRNNSFIATAASSRIVAAKSFHVLLQRRRAIFLFIFGPSMPQINGPVVEMESNTVIRRLYRAGTRDGGGEYPSSRGDPPFFYHV